MFNLERLRALDAIRRLGSVAAAARELHVTPSGVSQQLAKLEKETRHQLTVANGRGIRLTEAGLVLAEHARQVVGQLTAAQADLADLHSEILGPLRIGAGESTIRVLVAPALADLHARHPRLSPFLNSGEAVDHVPMLHAGELDVIVIESWENNPVSFPANVEHEHLLREEAQVALSESHPLADRDVVDLADLADTPWTACDPGTHESLIQVLRSVGVEPRLTCTATEFPSQLALVAAGLVAALIPPMGVPDPVPGVRLIPTRPSMRRELVTAWRADGNRPAVRAFRAAMHDATATVVPA